MKVRLSDAMVRFRLQKKEVQALAAGKAIALSLSLEPALMTVRLEPIVEAEASAVSQNGLCVGIPLHWLRGWPDSEVVGFDFEVPATADHTGRPTLRILVEKDFPCAHDGEGPPKPVRMP